MWVTLLQSQSYRLFKVYFKSAKNEGSVMWWGENKMRCSKQGIIKYEVENFMEYVVHKERK